MTDPVSCNDRLDCAWQEGSGALHWQCRAKPGQPANAEADCTHLGSKSRCNNQPVCTWDVGSALCKHGGQWQPCKALNKEDEGECAAMRQENICHIQTTCEWSGQCVCQPGYFGTDCGKQVVMPRTLQGKCSTLRKDQQAFCEGIVHASSLAGVEHFCTGNTACVEWQSIKDTSHLMWELESADLVMDGFGIVFNTVVVWALFSGAQKKLVRVAALLATIPFVVDLVLESWLIKEVSNVARPLTTLKQSGCFPVGESYDSIVRLEDFAVNIRVFAVLNITMAVTGTIGSCLQVVIDCSVNPVPAWKDKASKVMAIHDFIASLLELLFGMASLTMNTQPIMDALLNIESATLDPRSDQFCFYRNPDMPKTEIAGLQWQMSAHLLWLLPTLTCLLTLCACAGCTKKVRFVIAAGCAACVRGCLAGCAACVAAMKNEFATQITEIEGRDENERSTSEEVAATRPAAAGPQHAFQEAAIVPGLLE